jgi:cell division inhibitor SulA
MGTVVALSNLLEARQVWRGRALPSIDGGQPTGWPLLDAALPTRGWPEASLTEILLPADGIGELRLVVPTLARLTQGQRPVMLIAPPYAPCAMGWRQQGVNLQRMDIVDADEKHVLWAAEQCLRSGSCAAVLAWPQQADDRSLRRLQVAADTGSALAFVFRDSRHLANASPAALRLELVATPQPSLWIRKCRGGNAPVHPIPFQQHAANLSLPANSNLRQCEEQLPPLRAEPAPDLIRGEGWGGVKHLPETFQQELTPSQPPPASRGRGLLGVVDGEEGRW